MSGSPKSHDFGYNNSQTPGLKNANPGFAAQSRNQHSMLAGSRDIAQNGGMSAPLIKMTRISDWLDRLSGQLGALILLSRDWLPRHPVKVSLLMGLLGAIAGWIIYSFGHFWGRAAPTSCGDIYWGLPAAVMPFSSAISGVLILGPLFLWSKNSWWLAGFGVLIALLARYASEVVYAFPTPLFAEDFWLYISSGLEDLINALVHAAGVAWIIRRRVSAVICLSPLAGLFVSPISLLLFHSTHGSSLGHSIFEDSAYSLAWVGFYSLLAICLGISVWDFTPRLKFETTEVT